MASFRDFRYPQSFWSWLLVGGLVAIPTVLFILPPDFFDNGPPLCVSTLLFNVNCYACGMTRACMHFIHFDFEAAWMFNKLSFVVMPILSFLWLAFLLREFNVTIYKDLGA